MDDMAFAALPAALVRILRPLVRILLRRGISLNTFADIAKAIYDDIAMIEFAIKGRKPSVSRTSIITALSRALLDELLRVGKVVREQRDRLRLVAHACLPRAGETEKVRIPGTDMGALIPAIDRNMELEK